MSRKVQQSLPYSIQAADIIRDSILEGRYELGERLNEVELSTDLGISRSPIREALRTLEEEGLVRLNNGRGVFVASLPIEEVRELLELRQALDMLATRLAAERATVGDLELLGRSVESLTVLHHEGHRQDSPWSSDFHLAIFEVARNRKLRAQGGVVHRQLRLARFRSGSAEDRLAAAREEHLAIVDALRSHDADEAELRMRLHLDRASEHILRVLEELGANGK